MNILTLGLAAFSMAVFCLALLFGIRLLESQIVRSLVRAFGTTGAERENAEVDLAFSTGHRIDSYAVLLSNPVGRPSELRLAVKGDYGRNDLWIGRAVDATIRNVTSRQHQCIVT